MTTQPAAYLIINSLKYKIANPTTRIGRKLENDVVLQDILVSRFHAEIMWEDNKFIIRDLGSTYGTAVNNLNISQTELKSNDLIQIANIPIVFSLE